MSKKEKISLIVFRVLFTILLILVIVFILSNSMQIAEASSVRSVSWMKRINDVLSRLSLPIIGEKLVRKLAHFGEYALLGLVSMFCTRVYTARYIRHISWPILIGLLTAVADETVQLFYAGRSSQITDVWIDFMGNTAGIMCALVLMLFFKMCLIIYKEEKRKNHDGT